MKKKIVRIVIGILVVLSIAYTGASYYMMQVVTEPKVLSYNQIKTRLQERYSINIDEIPVSKTTVSASDDFKIETFIYRNPNPSGRVIVLSHGIRQNGQSMLNFFPMYQALGFDIVGFSYRNHGESSKSFTTLGKYEVKDLQAVMDYAHSQFGENVKYGIHGVSMGASVMIKYAAQNEAKGKYHFLISDCAFADFGALLNTRFKEDYSTISFLPLVQSSNFISKIIGRGDFFENQPKRDVENITVPMLFVHGKKDAYIPIDHVYQLHSAKKGKKILFEVEEGVHAENLYADKTGYNSAVEKLLAE